MSIKKSHISNIGDRILKLCALYSTDKEFLRICNIPNSAFITTIRKGLNKNPGANYLELVVRGTGCSGTWLLTGEGEMFEVRENTGKKPGESFNQALELVEQVERLSGGAASSTPPPDLPLRVAQLLVTLLEQRSSSSSESNKE